MTSYSIIRIYGMDCNQVEIVLNAAKTHNMKIFAGIWSLSNLQEDLKALIIVAQGSWSTFIAISIGNKLVNGGLNSVVDVVDAITTSRNVLRRAGYAGPVVTIDTFTALITHSELCRAFDFCAANCHAFFDPNTDTFNAGSFVKKQATLVSAAAGGGKTTVITESGWPHRGGKNGLAIPSRANQLLAVQGLKNTFVAGGGGLFLFEAFDSLWKEDREGTFGAEKFWRL